MKRSSVQCIDWTYCFSCQKRAEQHDGRKFENVVRQFDADLGVMRIRLKIGIDGNIKERRR